MFIDAVNLFLTIKWRYNMPAETLLQPQFKA